MDIWRVRPRLIECPLLALSGHHSAEFQCLLLGVKQTLLTRDKARRIAANIDEADPNAQ
jgi:hypothetical protein